MIVGVGIDSVEIVRFGRWDTFSPQKLARIFSPQEIEYCLQNPILSAQRFAARFAAREAFFKALQFAHQTPALPFLTLCKATIITKGANNVPILVPDWPLLQKKVPEINHYSALLSLTDTASTATAIVILQISG